MDDPWVHRELHQAGTVVGCVSTTVYSKLRTRFGAGSVVSTVNAFWENLLRVANSC